MDNGPLGMKWQVTVTKAYGRVTWQPGIGGKSRNKGLFMSERGEGLIAGADSSYEMGHNSGTSGVSGNNGG
jgi:hypothetical protein